jgi:hypothetical protein
MRAEGSSRSELDVGRGERKQVTLAELDLWIFTPDDRNHAG